MPANKDTSKPWFVTGAYPTQAQFYQVFDWLRWKDELLAITDIDGLQAILNTIITLAQVKANYAQLITLITDGTYDMTAGLIINGIVVDAPGDFILNVGTTPGGNDIIQDLAVVGGTPEAVSLVHYAKAAKTIYFSGITAATDFIILKNSI
jgi:hypothetical protein